MAKVPARKGRAFAGEPVDRGRLHVRIAQGADGIEPLLVGAIPEDIGAIVRHGAVWPRLCAGAMGSLPALAESRVLSRKGGQAAHGTFISTGG